MDPNHLPGDVARARELVLEHGWNSVAYQILNPGFRYWFSRRGDAVAGFVERGGVWVVGGAPVCDERRLAEVHHELAAGARAGGARLCYFGAGDRLYELTCDEGHAVVVLGAQPAWDPADWPEVVRRHHSVRAQLHRARNKGLAVREWSSGDAGSSPVLADCLRDWLARKAMPTMHFLVEPDTLGLLADRRVFVAERDGHVEGFLVATPVPVRQGWLFEQIIRRAGAPNGTSEALIDAAMRAVARSGSRYVTLGLAPLSSRAFPRRVIHPLWLRLALGWARAHGNRFFNFAGLESFKAKFDPTRWEPIFAISNEARFSVRSLHAIGSAFSDVSVWSHIGRALWKGVVQEVAWLSRSLRRDSWKDSSRER